MPTFDRRTLALTAVGLTTLAGWWFRVPDLLQQGYFQAELLASRVPIASVRDSGTYSAQQRARLDLVPQIKAFGHAQGLATTASYDTIAHRWNRTIYNVSACEPLAFTPVSTWFPITGSITYLGFFRPQDAERQANRFRQRGLDVYVRTAGAYSTLGWFGDPVLPGMLDWSEVRLADTLLHELTHATVWVPGSSAFNESVAQFVGNTASLRWLRVRHGPDSPEVVAELHDRSDRKQWLELLHGAYRDLDTLYTTLPDRAFGLSEKARIIGSLPKRVNAAPFHDPAPYLRASQTGTWNNARFVQFATYHSGEAAFQTVLDDCDGDLAAFLAVMADLPRRDPDPYVALAALANDKAFRCQESGTSSQN